MKLRKKKKPVEGIADLMKSAKALSRETNSVPTGDNFADEQGQAYVEADEAAKAANARKEKVNRAIKEKATKVGVNVGKNTLIQGKHFDVGYTRITSAYADEVTARKLLTKEQLKACTKVVPEQRIFDQALFEKAVNEERISRKLAAKIIKFTKPQMRILVSRKKSNPRP